MFALVEVFDENNAMDIVETHNIKNFCLSKARQNDNVVVKWTDKSKSTKLCCAKLLQIGENRADLASTIKKIEGNALAVIEPFIISQSGSSTQAGKRERKIPKWLRDSTETIVTNTQPNKKKVDTDRQKKVAIKHSLDVLKIAGNITPSQHRDVESISQELCKDGETADYDSAVTSIGSIIESDETEQNNPYYNIASDVENVDNTTTKANAASTSADKASQSVDSENVKNSNGTSKLSSNFEKTGKGRMSAGASLTRDRIAKFMKDDTSANFDSDESSESDVLSKRQSIDLLKAELSFERKRRIRVEKEFQNYKDSVDLVKQLQYAVASVTDLGVCNKQMAPPIDPPKKPLMGRNENVSRNNMMEKRGQEMSQLAESQKSQHYFKKANMVEAPRMTSTGKKDNQFALMKATTVGPTKMASISDKHHQPKCSNVSSILATSVEESCDDETIGEGNRQVLLDGTDIYIPADVFDGLYKKNYSRYSADLLLAVFGRATLQSHVLKGLSNSSKPVLDQNKLKQIIEHVTTKYNVQASLVRAAFRNKMSNARDKKPRLA